MLEENLFNIITILSEITDKNLELNKALGPLLEVVDKQDPMEAFNLALLFAFCEDLQSGLLSLASYTEQYQAYCDVAREQALEVVK